MRIRAAVEREGVEVLKDEGGGRTVRGDEPEDAAWLTVRSRLSGADEQPSECCGPLSETSRGGSSV